MNVPFSPAQSVTVAVTAGQVLITVGGSGHHLRFVNGGTGHAYVMFYEPDQTPPTVVATAAMMIPSGAIEIFAVASSLTRVAVTGDSTGTTLNVTRGEGQ